MRVIDLDGPDGNAFVLLGMCKGWAKQLGMEWEPLREEAMAGDYDHLVAVLGEAFKFVAVFERGE